MPLPPMDSTEFGVVVRGKGASAAAVGQWLQKNEEGLFKRQALDKLPELLKIIAEEEARLPMKLIEGTVL